MWSYSDRSAPPHGHPLSKGPPQLPPHKEGSDCRRFESMGPHPPPPPRRPPFSNASNYDTYVGGHGYLPPSQPPHHHHHHHHGPPPPPPSHHHQGPPYGHSEAPPSPHPGSFYDYPPLYHQPHPHGHGPPPPPPPHAHHGPPPHRHGGYPPSRPYYEPHMENTGPQSERTEQPRHGGGCTCKKSQCLKLYCQCFSSSTTCGPKCRCQACHNTAAHGTDIEEARRIILERNPSAFSDKFAGRTRPYYEDPKWAPPPPPAQRTWSYSHPEPAEAAMPPPVMPAPPPVTHKMGCKCRRSFCLKKYCECYTRGAQCGSNCRCTNCRNHSNASGGTPPPSFQGVVAMTTTISEEAARRVSVEEEGSPSERNDKMAIMAALAMTELLGSSEPEAPRKRKFLEEALVSTQQQSKMKASPVFHDEEHGAVVSTASSTSPTTVQSRNPSPVGMAPPVGCYTKNDEREHARVSPTYHEKPSRNFLPKSLSFRKICSRCGKTRGEHGELGFGNKCVYQDCGRCGAGVQMHTMINVPMGIQCSLSEKDGAMPGAADSYARKIRDLALRADMERGLKQWEKEVVEV